MRSSFKLFNPYSIYTFAPLEDDLPTNVGGGRAGYDDDAETQIRAGREAGGGILDVGEDDITVVGGETHIREMDATVLDVPETGTLALLWVVEGERRGKVYRIREGNMLGKHEGDLILDDPKVSTPHSRFRMENDKYVLWDCGSKNGTFVNGERIRCATVLEENDRIKIGDIVFVIKLMQ